MPTMWDLFCGCGGMSLGFEQAGFQSKFAFDWEKDQAATFALNRPDVPVLRMDVKQMSFKEIAAIRGKPDVLAGGPPCQGFSSASNPLDDKIRAPKRAIYFHAIRALGEVHPQLFFFENSPNVASQYSKPVFAALRKVGREAKFAILKASDFGVPQVRRRAFLIDPAIEPPTPTGEVMTPRKAFAGLSKPSESNSDELHRPRKATPEFTARIARAKPGGFLYQSPDGKGPWSYTNVRIHPDRPTMSVNSQGDFCHFKEARKLTFREYLRLQMMPDDYKFFASTPSNMRILVARILPPPFAKAWALKIKAALSKKEKAEYPEMDDHDMELILADFEADCQKIDSRMVRSVPEAVEEIIQSAIDEVTQQETTTIQTVMLSKERFKTQAAAESWIKRNKFKTEHKGKPVDETKTSWRFRQRDPGEFDKASFRTISLTDGVKAVVGKLKDVQKGLSPAQQKECDEETAKIKENKKKPEAKKKHKFKPAKYTFGNGHPRCLICGDEETVDGICNSKARSSVSLGKVCEGACTDCQVCSHASRGEEVDKTVDIKLLPVEKADEDKRIVFGVVLEPNSTDSQGDTIKPEEIERAAHIWLARFQNRGFMHRRIVNSKIEIYESYLAPTNLTIGGQKVKKGTWLLMYHVLDDELWKDIKSGKLTGFSMGGRARRVPTKT